MKAIQMTFDTLKQVYTLRPLLYQLCGEEHPFVKDGVKDGKYVYHIVIRDGVYGLVLFALSELKIEHQEIDFEQQRHAKFLRTAEKILYRLFQEQGDVSDEQIAAYKMILADELYDFAVRVAQETYNADHDHYIDFDEAESRYIVPRQTLVEGDA